MQPKTIALILLLVLATVGAIGIGTATIQSVKACTAIDPDDVAPGSTHDSTGDCASGGHA